MSHLTRAALLLILFVVGFLLLRSIATSVVSLEIIGLSRADNPREWATRPVQNQPSETCAECHEAKYASRQASAHASNRCENCHGATRDHVEQARNNEDASLLFPDTHDLCLNCHAKISSRPPDFPQVDPSTHGVVLEGTTTSCTSCHNPHNPGVPPEIPHSLEGRSECSVCHGPGKWKPLPAYLGDLPAEVCPQCHSVE